jgi:hypothetical protein
MFVIFLLVGDSLEGGRNGVRASSWSRRSGHFVDRGASSPRSLYAGRRCSFSGRECANATTSHATHWRPDTTFVKRMFFFALTQFPTFEGKKMREEDRVVSVAADD